MTYRDEIWKRLEDDRPLRQIIALEIGLGEPGVTLAIKRKSKSLYHYAVVKLLMKELGCTEESLFNYEEAAA